MRNLKLLIGSHVWFSRSQRPDQVSATLSRGERLYRLTVRPYFARVPLSAASSGSGVIAAADQYY